MKHALLMLALLLCTRAEPPRGFLEAIHRVETGGRLGAITGDGGRALGPLQIHESYWRDSGVGGNYAQCAGLEYSRQVVAAYLQRYARGAWDAGDVRTLARIHNGGPRGHRKTATLRYAEKVEHELRIIGIRY